VHQLPSIASSWPITRFILVPPASAVPRLLRLSESLGVERNLNNEHDLWSEPTDCELPHRPEAIPQLSKGSVRVLGAGITEVFRGRNSAL
jgi:hypothetical protein